jgi:hypothetical protein
MAEPMALGKVCAACGVERKKKGIRYSPEDFMPYCDNPYVCNENHPNAPKNLLLRGAELALIPYAEAEEKYKAYLDKNLPNSEMAEKIRRMVTNPTTVRVADPGLAQFLLEFQEEMQFDSISDTIRFCVQKMRESRHGFYSDHKVIAEAKAEEKRVEVQKAEIEKAVAKPIQPKTEPEPDEEEVFTV